MDNWRPSAEAGDDWRAQFPPPIRPGMVIYLMKSVNSLFPCYGEEGLEELKKMALQFEEKICIAAMSKFDYMEKMLLMEVILESTLENTFPNSLPSNPSGSINRPPDSGASYNMQPQVHNQGQPHPMPMSANQSQAREQILSQNIPSNMGSTGVHSMQNISEVLQSSEGNSMGRGVPSNINNPQRQMPGTQHVNLQEAQRFLLYLYQQVSDKSLVRLPAFLQKKTLAIQQLMARLQNDTNMRQNQVSGQQNQHTYLSSSFQQTSLGPLQANITNFLSQSRENMLQQNTPLQSNPNMLQHEHLKQQQEHMVQQLIQQQLNQHQMQQQLMQQERLQQQQFNRQAKQQLPAQMQAEMVHSQQLSEHEKQQQFMKQQMLQQQMVHSQELNQHEMQQQLRKQQIAAEMQAHQMPQVYQRDDVNEPDVSQQHISRGQHALYTFQQMKSGASFPISSPQSPQLQQNIPLQSNQHEHLKQQQEHMVHSKQLNQNQMQEMLQLQQFNQQAKQKLPAQLNQQEQQMLQQQQGHMVHSQQLNKHEMQQMLQQQQLPAQMQAYQMRQMHQRDDVDEQHISKVQHALYTHQQMESGAYFPISSPQLLQAASPHLSEHSSPEDYLKYLYSPTKDETPLLSGTENSTVIVSSPWSEHSSPEVDQQNLLSFLTDAEILLLSATANSPSIVSSSSTPSAPSPMPGDSEKPLYEFSLLSNAKPD